MILKQGVSTRGISNELLIALIIANEVYAAHGVNMVVTSLVDGKHYQKSRHWSGDGGDLRTHNLPTGTDPHEIVRDIQDRLNSRDYDVILEGYNTPNEHIHIEFDPKGGPG